MAVSRPDLKSSSSHCFRGKWQASESLGQSVHTMIHKDSDCTWAPIQTACQKKIFTPQFRHYSHTTMPLVDKEPSLTEIISWERGAGALCERGNVSQIDTGQTKRKMWKSAQMSRRSFGSLTILKPRMCEASTGTAESPSFKQTKNSQTVGKYFLLWSVWYGAASH